MSAIAQILALISGCPGPPKLVIDKEPPQHFSRLTLHPQHSILLQNPNKLSWPEPSPQNDRLTSSQIARRAQSPVPRPLARHRNAAVHRAHQAKTTLPPTNLSHSTRQSLSAQAPPCPQERILPPSPAPTAVIRAREALLWPLRSPEGRMQIRNFQRTTRDVGGIYAGYP